MQQELLDGITFPYDDATRKKLLFLYKQKESLLDGEIVQEHLVNQPLLGVLLLMFAILSLGTFIFAIIFIACRALDNCGSKRYQSHPTSGRRYVFYLVLLIISWVGLAGATIHFMTAGIALWDQNTDSETEPQHSSPLGLQPRRYVRSQRSKEEKTVGQLFEDSDYAGDFEQVDFTTIAEPSFVTKMPLRTTTAHVLKQSKKQGNFKHVKRVRHFYGRRLRTNSTTPSNASPTSFLYEIGPKPAMRDVEVNSLTSPPPSSPPIFHNSPARKLNATFATRGVGSIKAIRGPFVSDMWSNAGKQAFYRHDAASMTAGSSSSAALVVDNSVTRTDLIGIQQPGLPNLTDFESGHENTVADEDAASVETSPTSTAMTTTLAQTSSTALPTTTFSNSPMTAETMSTTEYSTITSEYSESETVELLSTIPNEVPEDIEESSNTSTTTEEVELLDAETKELHYSASAESNPTPKSLPSDIPSLQTEGFSSTTTMMETSTTLMPTTTSSTTSSTTTAATSVATSTATSVATSTATSVATSTPTIVATTKPTTTTNALTTTTTTITKDALEAAATIVPEAFAKDEVVDKIKDAVPELMATKWGNRASEQEQLLSSSTSRSAQVDSTTSLRQEKKRLVNYRKARFESESMFPVETVLEQRRHQNSTSTVEFRSTYNGYSSWIARFFVLFIGVVMVLLVIPMPVLLTAGTVCYMRSYHPMDRTVFSERIGQVCVVLATILLFLGPCLHLYLGVLLTYMHIYFTMCPAIELLLQFKTLPTDDFAILNGALSNGNNTETCKRNLETIQGIWIGCFAFALFSIPAVFALFKISKYYLRMKTEYYWNVGDGYGVIRPKVATTTDAIYGNIYGTLQKKRPTAKPPPRPVERQLASEPVAYGVYVEQPIYGAFQ